MIYVTGDIHGSYLKIKEFCTRFSLNENDTIVILGDVGANFECNKNDECFKYHLNSLGPTMFCIHGNHEKRPECISSYERTFSDKFGGIVQIEKLYPNLVFALDGEIYNIDNHKTLVIGGAYSIDKYYRFSRYVYNAAMLDCLDRPFSDFDVFQKFDGDFTNDDKKFLDELMLKYPSDKIHWWPNEQPDEIIKNRTINNLNAINWNVDVVLSHTCPYDYMPIDAFIGGVNQNMVDNSTEHWLNEINAKLSYDKWYCGHFHIDRHLNDKFTFLFTDFEEFLKDKCRYFDEER